MFVKPLVTATA